MRLKSILPLALCLLLTGCGPKPGPSPSAAPSEAPSPSESIGLPAPQWGVQVYQSSFTVEGRQEPVFSPEYRLPQIDNADGVPAFEAINAYYAARLDDLAATASELSAWAVEDYNLSLTTDLPFYGYVDTVSYELTLETPTRVSILCSHYTSAGTPAPVLLPMGDTFDLTTGARLTFADLFSCPEEEASQRVLSALLSLNESGAYAGTVLDADALRGAYQPNYFYLTEDSLVCFFPGGELPRAVGTPTFAVPYTELEDILRPWE